MDFFIISAGNHRRNNFVWHYVACIQFRFAPCHLAQEVSVALSVISVESTFVLEHSLGRLLGIIEGVISCSEIVFDYSQVFVDVVSSTEAYVYFKLPPAKEAHDVIFTLGGEDGMIFGYSVPDGTCITKPAEPGQEGKLFLGWYTEEGEKWDFATPVTKDLLLTAKFEDVTPTVLYGDVDGDTKVTAADALEVLKSVVGKVTLTEAQFTAADTDGNGKADATDALNILKKVVGKIEKFPIEQ